MAKAKQSKIEVGAKPERELQPMELYVLRQERINAALREYVETQMPAMTSEGMNVSEALIAVLDSRE